MMEVGLQRYHTERLCSSICQLMLSANIIELVASGNAQPKRSGGRDGVRSNDHETRSRNCTPMHRKTVKQRQAMYGCKSGGFCLAHMDEISVHCPHRAFRQPWSVHRVPSCPLNGLLPSLLLVFCPPGGFVTGHHSHPQLTYFCHQTQHLPHGPFRH